MTVACGELLVFGGSPFFAVVGVRGGGHHCGDDCWVGQSE